ncbi:MAG: 2-phospho-L-lactate guanylyltransferase [Aeromicrobium sp.]
MTAWTAIVPVKAWRSAKSRLGVPGELRAELAQALTLDTLDVLASHPSVGHVVVVTADPSVADEARSRGLSVLAEEPATDPLNAAVRQGCSWVASRGDGPTVVVPADLAYLSAEVLETTLASLAERGRAHVPDLAGTGTTLLAASRASDIDPHYGVGSSALHAAAGFPRLERVDPRARTDVDELADLAHGPTWVPGLRVAAVMGRKSQSA